MAITSVFFDTAAAPGSKLDPEVAAEVEHLAPGLEAGEVGETELANDAVTRDKIAPGAVGSVEIGADQVDTEHYAPDSVDTAAIAPDAVTATEAGIGVSTAYDINGNPIEDKRVYCTAAQYAALAVKDPNTEYLVSA
ncbi:tail fiber protein [Mycobacterium phage BirdsNest]|uniref:Minor tail protein gp31 C-terminal domain-containing protein n=1 Tax=Mycobacterium phage BirdsNest TaxID=2686231 RepID=A0A6B9LF45_9CAUD|nr:tail fiber protein [Mycobacterium phage BirdsNest]QHB37345.1 hypothetical protein PBI_BIRDSNEST_43 [Mycobacterium phage BirdsNest]